MISHPCRKLRLSSALALTLAMPVSAVWAADPLAEVRALYASAAYEDTLALLTHVDDPALQDAADEYRALCLLALNREAAAEEAVAALIRRRPHAPDDLATRAPKFVALYKAVRARLLPSLATSSYVAAKSTFEAGNMAAAAGQFRDALALLRVTREQSPGAAPFADFEVLASGFLSLAERRLAEARAAAAPKEPLALTVEGAVGLSAVLRSAPSEASVVSAPAVPEARRDAAPTTIAARADAPTGALTARGAQDARGAFFPPVPRIFDATDTDVTPPVVIEQKLPRWKPPHAMLRQRRFFGRLEVIVDVDGRVASAEILQPSFSVYDDQVLKATKDWRYQPALKREFPVQFRRVIDYVLREAPEQSAQ